MYKKIFGETIVYGISAVLPRVINYCFLKFFTNVLAGKDFSLYIDMYALSFLLINLLTFGLESAYFRFLHKQKDVDSDKIFSSVMISLLLISLIFLFLGIFFVKEISYLAGYSTHKEYFLIFFLIIFFDILSSIPMAWLRMHSKALRYAFIRIISVVIQAFITFLLLIGNNEFSIIHLKFLETIKGYTDKPGYIFFANMLASMISFIALTDVFIKIRLKKFSLKTALEMIVYGIPIMIGSLSFAINENLDKILIKRWLSDEINSAYSACYKIAALMALYSTTFRMGIEPFYFIKAKEADAKKVYSELTYLFTLFGIIFFVLLWSNLNWIINLINSDYQSTRNIIPVIMMANLFLGIYINFSIAYKVKDQPIVSVYISLFGVLVTILSNLLLLLPKGSYMAPAWGTLVSYGSMMLISYWWGQRYYKINYRVSRILCHIVLGIISGYSLGEIIQYYNVIGQLLYLCIVFFMEKSILIKILYG